MQIMALTGHKSLALLAIYEKVNSEEKLNMVMPQAINS